MCCLYFTSSRFKSSSNKYFVLNSFSACSTRKLSTTYNYYNNISRNSRSHNYNNYNCCSMSNILLCIGWRIPLCR